MRSWVLLALAALGLTAGCGTVVRRADVTTGSPGASAKTLLRSPVVANVGRRLLSDQDGDDAHDATARRDSASVRVGSVGHSSADEEVLDSDDVAVRSFGHAASQSDASEITALVRRYYAAAAAGDGATACALMYVLISGAVAEEYRGPPVPTYLRGSTCQKVMSEMLRHNHALVSWPTQIVAIRVGQVRAYVLMGSAKLPAVSVALHRERHTWKVDSLLPSQLP